ncbi:MAG: hypothetical protein H7841_10350 [Magnetospirillum sp. WYHS-4]
MPRLAAIATAVLALAGACQTERMAVGPEGSISILGTDPWDVLAAPGESWRRQGPTAKGVSRSDFDGFSALRVTNGDDGFAIVRPIKAILPASPYLTWAWNAEPHGLQGHAVHLLVGFRGGRNGGSLRGGPWSGGDLPDHDRLLVISWGGSALQRGSLQVAERDGSARYTARGGREQAGIWWRETVDLQVLHARAWPGDDRNDVHVAFIGFGAAEGQPAGSVRFSGIGLSR